MTTSAAAAAASGILKTARPGVALKIALEIETSMELRSNALEIKKANVLPI